MCNHFSLVICKWVVFFHFLKPNECARQPFNPYSVSLGPDHKGDVFPRFQNTGCRWHVSFIQCSEAKVAARSWSCRSSLCDFQAQVLLCVNTLLEHLGSPSRSAAVQSIRAESGPESEVRSESLGSVRVLVEPQGNWWFKYCENLYQHRKWQLIKILTVKPV